MNKINDMKIRVINILLPVTILNNDDTTNHNNIYTYSKINSISTTI